MRAKRPKAATEEERLERRREQARAWKAENPDRVRKARAAYYALNKEREKACTAAWMAAHADTYPATKRLCDARYRQKNAARIAAKQSEPTSLEKRNLRERNRYATDLRYRVEKVLRSCFVQALRLGRGNKECSALGLIGCSTPELIRHIERQFNRGMSWDNYGEWEIDHIRPCASFDLTDTEEQKACFHFTNLRPIWRDANRSKSDRITLLV